MKISNIQVKKPGTCLPVEVKCPFCSWCNEFHVFVGSETSGEVEDTCCNCKAILTFHWQK